MLFTGHPDLREGWEPGQAESATKHGLDRLPPAFSDPPDGLLLLEGLYAGLVGPDGRHLGAEHDGREQGKQQSLKDI